MNAALQTPRQPEDWHPADVVAALKKKESSLAAVERKYHYARRSLSMLWTKYWPKGQEVVAREIGLDPWVIWPTRYTPDHTPKTGRPTRIAVRVRGRNV